MLFAPLSNDSILKFEPEEDWEMVGRAGGHLLTTIRKQRGTKRRQTKMDRGSARLAALKVPRHASKRRGAREAYLECGRQNPKRRHETNVSRLNPITALPLCTVNVVWIEDQERRDMYRDRLKSWYVVW